MMTDGTPPAAAGPEPVAAAATGTTAAADLVLLSRIGRLPPAVALAAAAFVVSTGPAGTTRVVVRERYAYTRWWAPLIVEPAASVSAVMSPRMLRGIRRRAEGIANSRRDQRTGGHATD